ncbi:hypothetical protein [Nocardioides sp.]|uniref:hypothetical protein n=1 Tax=Nocardioides sp. TaxID=35761 RepID=UPI0039E65EFF
MDWCSTTTVDPRPLLAHALDQTEALVTGILPDQRGLPTPCQEYGVAMLVAHLQAVVQRIGAVLAGRPFFSVPREPGPAGTILAHLRSRVTADDDNAGRDVLDWRFVGLLA